MARLDLPSVSSVAYDTPMRNACPSRLPSYRLSHMTRFHPYARVVQAREDHCTASVAPFGADGPQQDSYIALDRHQRTDACEEARDADAERYEDPVVRTADAADGEALGSSPQDGAASAHAPAPARPLLGHAIFDLFELVRRRYFSLEAVTEFLKFDALKK
ncbi:hypothetical protein PYCCODRAFT_1429357 [Trametes coccinea BRFM310]|uniref:Uncharacterized protein n=1 Tax=Trametes coccinea (strain BRFM310) TaxID=1353009 RepID=A0A1Y2J663_TRAC3|nr:hypothetical protein PYCCODRAFT_1429357 [Trametes coccinea BRFM310]